MHQIWSRVKTTNYFEPRNFLPNFPPRRSQCGFSGSLPLICCPEETREEREETTPFPGTARRGFTGEEERGRREEEQRGGTEEEEKGDAYEEFPVFSNFFPVNEEFP